MEVKGSTGYTAAIQGTMGRSVLGLQCFSGSRSFGIRCPAEGSGQAFRGWDGYWQSKTKHIWKALD